MLEVLGIKDPDQIIPLEDEIEAQDPVGENMDILNEKPVKAFQYQDHEAHIQTHLSVGQDPKIQELLSKAPSAQAIQGGWASHIAEHVAFQYRVEIEKQLGVSLPPIGESLPADIEVQLSKLVAEASSRLLAANQAEQQQKEAQEQAEDPIIQMKKKELDIREMETMANIEDKKARLQLDFQKMSERNSVERERIETNERVAEAKIGAEITTEMMVSETKLSEEKSRERIEGAKVAAEVAEILSRE
tara:strand:- start:297 stop:1034 length:738 start_codon:yes stop_codon:yes gene_type:complete